MDMIGNRLKIARENNGHSQRSLAELLNMGEKQIWRYENEKTKPSGEDVAKIAQTLGISSDYLLGLSDDPTSSQNRSNLSEQERSVLSAMRRGNVLEAIHILSAESEGDPVGARAS